MVAFRVNLIRNRPVPLPQRRHVALALLVYLLASGLLLAWAFYQATRDVLDARRQSQLGDEQRRAFLSQHTGWLSVDAYAENLRRQLHQADATLEATDRLLKRRLAVAHVLQGLAAPLPADARLQNIEINVAGSTLQFDLAVPVNLAGGSADTSAIMTSWRNAPVLKRTVADLREQSSQQIELDGLPFFLLRFAATLLEET